MLSRVVAAVNVDGIVTARKGSNSKEIAEIVGLWRFAVGRGIGSVREGAGTGNLLLRDIGLGEMACAISDALVKGTPESAQTNVWLS